MLTAKAANQSCTEPLHPLGAYTLRLVTISATSKNGPSHKPGASFLEGDTQSPEAPISVLSFLVSTK